MPDNDIPFLSVILPVYNGSRFLRRAVDSVRRQHFPRWELLAVDDGSTDDGLALLHRLAGEEPRLRVLQRPSGGGVSAARNTALGQAQGEWVAYLDQDDEFYPGYLQQVFDHRGQGDVLVFDYDLLEERPGHPRLGQVQTWSPRRVCARLLTEHITVPLGVAHRRALLDRVGLFDEALRIDEEADLLRRFARAGVRFVYLSQRSGLYHVRPDSAARLIRGGHDPRGGIGAAGTAAAGPPSPTAAVEVRLGEERHLLRAPRGEVGVVRQVFQGHEYGGVAPHWLRQPPTVLDVGANVGAFALYAKLFYHRRAQVHCFEPFPPSVELLRQNLAPFADVNVHPFALGGSDRTAPLFVHRSLSVCHSLVRGLFGGQERELAVPVRNAGRVWDELGLQEVDVLKLDAEGSEVEVLEGLGPRLGSVRCVLAEFHRRQDRRHIDALLAGFELFGLKLHSLDVGVLKYARADLLGARPGGA